MTGSSNDHRFAGSIPEIYQRYMVPLLFEVYAEDLAARVAALRPRSAVLELACGTGVLTRRLSPVLPGVRLTATDLNAPMLELAASLSASAEVTWQPADAEHLPFGDAAFDVVACQFGVMFFPDKVRAFAQARRVLRVGGAFAFNSWDTLESSALAHTVNQTLSARYGDQLVEFMARVPHGYHRVDDIRRDLSAAGFGEVEQVTLTETSRAASARDAATAFCHGTPLRHGLEALGALTEGTELAAQAIAARFGPGEVEAPMRAHVFVARRD